MIDKAIINKILMIFAVVISVIVIYMFVSPYQNCKRDILGSFEDAYGDTSTWSERHRVISGCSQTTSW